MTVAAASTQPPPPQQQPKPTDGQLIALILAAFAASYTASAILSLLRRPFARAGIGSQALKAGIGLVLAMPQQPMEGTGPAQRWAVRTNELRRSSFTLSASRRIQQAIDDARAHGEPLGPAIGDAARAEQRFFAAHVQASDQRIKATSAVDGMAGMYGNLLGWHAVKDKNVTPGCLAADGKNFRADDPPVVEGSPSYPGAVHARCRCFPVPPRPGAPILPGLKGGQR